MHQVGRPDTQETDASLPRLAVAEQLATVAGNYRRLVGGAVQGAGTGQRGEVTVADLDRQGAGRQLFTLEAIRHPLRKTVDLGVHLCQLLQILGVGALGAQALARMPHPHRALVDAAGIAVEGAAVTTEKPLQPTEGLRPELTDSFDPGAFDPALGGRTHTRQAADRERIQKRLHPPRLDHRQPVWFVEVGGDLGDQPVGCHSHADGQTTLLLDLKLDLLGHGRGAAPGLEVVAHIQIGLIYRDLLDDGGKAAEDVEDLLRLRAVATEIGLDKDRMRAEPHCAGRRHRRVDPVLAYLVARGRHHPPTLGAAADDDRLALERRVVADMNRGIERVHVAVEDATDWGNLRHGEILSRPWRQ